MAHFSNAIIHGSTFNSAQGDLHIHNRDSESGLQTLKLGVSLGAIHDSAERSPPSNCHPGTRKAVRQIILDWIHSESSESSFFWLYGPAGAGKTAILQAIAEFLCNLSESDQNFGGSFFFSRGKKGRDKGDFLFSTIAYQLALKVPGLREPINRIMEFNPTLPTKSMGVQLKTLIVDAFKDLPPLPQRSYLVIIDGLDECHDKKTQQSILQLLCETITVHKLPLRFLIGSRPEFHIRTSFDQESLRTITHRVVLDESFNPGRDIQVFLQDGFAKICAENPIPSHVEEPWPGKGIIDLLVQRSSGQFIYAATVLKFVGADFCSPTTQLELVMKPDPTAFSDLDQLYTQILSVYPSAVNIVQILGFIIVSHRDSPEVIEDILGMKEGELKQVLRGLSSLMEENRKFTAYVIPHFAHASFSDYLFDSSRSGPFYVNRQEYENQFTIRSFAFIMKSIRSWKKMSSITQFLRIATWDYFTSRLPIHFSRSPQVVKEAIITDIKNLVQEFLRTSSDVGASLFAMRRLFEILQDCFGNFELVCIDIISVFATVVDLADKNLQNLAKPWGGNKNYWHFFAQLDLLDQIRAIYDDRIRAKLLLDGYRKMFDRSFSRSRDLGDMLRFLPGVVVQRGMNMQGMAVLYRIEPDLLERFIESTIEPLRPCHVYPYSWYKLDSYLSGFLQDRDRSRHYYCDPILQHISICRHFLSLLDGLGSNSLDFQSDDLCGYVNSYFYDHLCAATTVFLNSRNVSDDHPAVEVLHHLETTAYYVDENLSGYTLAQRIIHGILRWASMLNCRLRGVAVSVSNVDLMERMCHLTNKIYREILCITKHEMMTYITMGGFHHVHVSAFSLIPQSSIVLSWDLLAWILVEDRILCSFTKFITTPEFSGPLYISPDIYHTQITVYLLKTVFLTDYPQSGCFFDPVLNLCEHLFRALPTETIFYLLRSIRSEHLICAASTQTHTHTELILGIIIHWLERLGSERPGDLYDRFQGELLRHKAESSVDVDSRYL